MAILTSEGRIIIYSPPIISHPQANHVYEIQPQIEVFLSGKSISAFDWLNNSHNDVIACGDLTGNIFLVKLFPQAKFEVIKIYYQAHSEEITDLRFFPCNSEDNPLFASSSNDGFLKIFDTHNHETPLFEMHVSKVFFLFFEGIFEFFFIRKKFLIFYGTKVANLSLSIEKGHLHRLCLSRSFLCRRFQR